MRNFCEKTDLKSRRKIKQATFQQELKHSKQTKGLITTFYIPGQLTVKSCKRFISVSFLNKTFRDCLQTRVLLKNSNIWQFEDIFMRQTFDGSSYHAVCHLGSLIFTAKVQTNHDLIAIVYLNFQFFIRFWFRFGQDFSLDLGFRQSNGVLHTF